jgi:glucose-fructose oxidoreductase
MPRRRFLAGTGALAGAALGFAGIVSDSTLGLGGKVSANNRINMGMIGVGSMGSGHVRGFLSHQDVRVVAACDVRREFRDRAKRTVDSHYGRQECAVYADFRELLARPDIDAVLIAVPDHWHALIGIEAARRGKAMYYEKPMGRTVAEAQAVRRAVLQNRVVFQFGTQQRSGYNHRFACELVRTGRIGELHTIMIGSAEPSFCPNQPAQPVPPGFDYEMWLGPAPRAPYTYERCTRNWTLIHDYSLGCLSGAWGIHDVDIAQWALDSDGACPVEVEGAGVYPTDGLYDTLSSWEVEHRYPNGVKLIHMDMTTARKRAPQFELLWMAMLFEGTEGWVYVSRSGIHTHPESLARTVISANESPFPRSTDHRRDFLDAVRGRKTSISPIEAAVSSDIVCHQADAAIQLGRKLRWDQKAEKFVDDQANRFLQRAMRSPWHL